MSDPREDTQPGPNKVLEAGTRIERWFDRLADWSFSLFCSMSCMLVAALLLQVVEILPHLMAKVFEFLILAMIFPFTLFPLWITRLRPRDGQRRGSGIGSGFSRWIRPIADREGTILSLLAGLLLVFMVLASRNNAPLIFGRIAFVLGLFMVMLLAIVMLRNARRADRAAVHLADRMTHRNDLLRGVPGHRKWKANVYDENAYAILGVAQDATATEIRAAFKELVQKYHPHAVPAKEKERATLVFERIDQAYSLLSYHANRVRYDAWIEHLKGDEPTLDEACERFRDPVQCAMFDEAFRCHETVNEERFDQDPPAPYTGSSTAAEQCETTAGDPEPGTKAPIAPIEVRIPDSVREALGIPPPQDDS